MLRCGAFFPTPISPHLLKVWQSYHVTKFLWQSYQVANLLAIVFPTGTFLLGKSILINGYFFSE